MVICTTLLKNLQQSLLLGSILSDFHLKIQELELQLNASIKLMISLSGIVLTMAVFLCSVVFEFVFQRLNVVIVPTD